jgi:hypothetical protein
MRRETTMQRMRVFLAGALMAAAGITTALTAADTPGHNNPAATATDQLEVANPNLLANPGFEEGFKGWWCHPRNNPESSVIKEGAHSGQGVLRVQVANDISPRSINSRTSRW